MQLGGSSKAGSRGFKLHKKAVGESVLSHHYRGHGIASEHCNNRDVLLAPTANQPNGFREQSLQWYSRQPQLPAHSPTLMLHFDNKTCEVAVKPADDVSTLPFA